MFVIESQKQSKNFRKESFDSIKKVFYAGLLKRLQNDGYFSSSDLQMLDLTGIGEFPWSWNSDIAFNKGSYNWLNHFFFLNPDGYLQADNNSLLSAYYETLLSIDYALSNDEQHRLETVVQRNRDHAEEVINSFMALFGAIPSGFSESIVSKLNYISCQILSWGNNPIVLDDLVDYKSALVQLSNRPAYSEKVIFKFVAYLHVTKSVRSLQNACLSGCELVLNCIRNIQQVPSYLSEGWMLVKGQDGMHVVPRINIKESVTDIQKSLFYPPQNSTITLHMQKNLSGSVKTTVPGSGVAHGNDTWITMYTGNNEVYTPFSFSKALKEASIKVTYQGLTEITPEPLQYDPLKKTGWWNPRLIHHALKSVSGSGLSFKVPRTGRGKYGFLSSFVIGQHPIFEITYKSKNASTFSEVFTKNGCWGIDFLGCPLCSGARNAYIPELYQDTSAGTVTIKMVPKPSYQGSSGPLAHVIGASIEWLSL
ncbi:hypothetical protein RCC89_10940 [Cytophagaceae bacterium ABcell3]|nr:hypothetical protein RCC89_10940 [Cytophagaceae bacterium ABcell3]